MSVLVELPRLHVNLALEPYQRETRLALSMAISFKFTLQTLLSPYQLNHSCIDEYFLPFGGVNIQSTKE